MAARLPIPVASTSRRLAKSRVFSTSSYTLASSKSRPTASSPEPQRSVEPELKSSEGPLDSLQDPSIPETPESRSLYQQNRPTPLRRPGVKPPPTLALPSSMLPPPPRVPLPMSLPGKAGSNTAATNETTFNIYMNSLNKRDDEPTLGDLDALRPPPSTVRAALEGVIGSGRALLAKNHPLHLAIEQLGAQEATVGGGPKAKRTVVAGSKKAKNLEYQALYAATEGMITRGFTVAQLKRLEHEAKMQRGKKGNKKFESPPGKTTKPRLIHSLMNLRWGMIHPKVLENYLDDESKPIEQSYHVSPSELFIFLGRDGEDLIHLSKELKMRITVDRQPLDPQMSPDKSPQSDRSTARAGFIIRASGIKSNHEKLRKYIENQRDTMTVRIVGLPTGSSLAPSLLQSISRIAGAFVENLDPKFASLNEDGSSAASVSITARSPRSAYTAERLVRRAAMEAAHRSQLSLFALLKEEKSPIPIMDEVQDSENQGDQFALYPFSTHGFRVRNVRRMDPTMHFPANNATQLPLTTKFPDIKNYDQDEAFILTGNEHLGTESQIRPTMIVRDVHGQVIDLGKHIFESSVGEDKRILTATFGHVIFKGGKTTTLESPLPRPVSGDSMFEWVDKQSSTNRVFIPGQVPSAPLPHNVTSVHRLQYRTIEGGNIINVDVELPGNDVEPSGEETGTLEAPSEDDSVDGLELVSPTQASTGNTNEDRSALSQSEGSSDAAELQGVESASPDSTEVPDATEFTPLPAEITVGTETALELITMDIYLQVSNTTPMVKSMVPEVLDIYLDGLSKFFTTDIEMTQPDPPQYLNFDGQHYALVKNTSARGGESAFANLPRECTVISESSLDLESNVRTAFTQLTCSVERCENDWNSFIGACQTLASKPYTRSKELRISPT